MGVTQRVQVEGGILRHWMIGTAGANSVVASSLSNRY